MSENGAAMCCQQTAFAPQSISLELGDGHQAVDGGSECYDDDDDDDDGRTKRTVTLWMASAHIVTVVGSGVLSAIKRSNCFREKGQKPCHASKHSLHDHLRRRRDLPLPDLVALAAVLSFTYSSIGQGIAQVVGPPPNSQSFLALEQRKRLPHRDQHRRHLAFSLTQKVWYNLQAFGDIAFAYFFSLVLIEIQDTSKRRRRRRQG
ncbi:hypothetical protein ZIOFF_066408 [Zingiber officinale]|uniref:Uncharacterized protein n=1 Tax=Zingiber officinale TaxID=94328 RepID=A0A8J5F3D1_ZINOF|nr:hypothetical protein ZIOFF_066408 [Zingiber officinale]